VAREKCDDAMEKRIMDTNQDIIEQELPNRTAYLLEHIPFSPEEKLWDKLKFNEFNTAEVGIQVKIELPTAPNSQVLLNDSLKWAKQPFPYQVEGIQALISKDCLLLADDMGLGKTLQAIYALRLMVCKKTVQRVLIIVPAGLIIQWRKDIHQLAPEIRVSTVFGPAEERAYQWRASATVFLTSYETIRNDFTSNPQSPARRQTWDVVVIDEAQKIKNPETEASRKCKRLPKKRAWALTGTPLENKPEDLAAILEFTSPNEDGGDYEHIKPGTRMVELQKQLQLRRGKSDVLLQLPPKIVTNISLSIGNSQRQIYDQVESKGILQLKEKGNQIKISNVLELILRLKQLCNFNPLNGESSKIEDITEKLKTLVSEGHRAIIFSQFVDNKFGVHAIYQKLKHFQPLVFSGALNSQQKERVVQSFKSDPDRKVLLLSLRAGGQGLNLQEASYVFHFDSWWNPAVEHQAEDRTHRLGQTSPVHVYRYTCVDTIEERIAQILEQKQQLFNELVDGVSIDLSSKLNAEELLSLFGLKNQLDANI
jgi:SNF2 family DNA or RNA helicase